MDPAVSDRILAAVRDAIVANVDGILAIGAMEAVLFAAIFRVGGITSPAMWGVFAGLSSMIPPIGAATVWLPVTITLGFHGTWIKAAVIGIVCLATQEGVRLLLLQRMTGTRLRQPALLVALSVLGATSACGALGIVVGPVIVSILGALVQEFRIQLRLNPVPEAKTRELARS
jgi:predicted PurR-regulated permease PerM